MTITENSTSSLLDEDVRMYLDDLSLRSWYNRKPVIIYLFLLVVAGIIGNTWCLLVYFFCFSFNSTHVLIMSMSICDLVTNVVGLPLQIYTIRHAYDSFDVALCRTMFLLATLPTQLSGFLILIVAFDRYRHICKPFSVKLGASKAAKLVASAVVITFVLFLPFTWLYGYHTLDSPRPGVKVVMCWVQDDYRGGYYSRAYVIVVSTCFFLGVFILAVLYSLIGETIFRHRFSVSVRVRAVTVHYPHPPKGQTLLSPLSKKYSAGCKSKAEEQDDSVEGQDDKTKYEPDSNKCIVTTVAGEDTPKPDVLSSPASKINKETLVYNIEDSSDLCEREIILDKKVTEGAISVITANKRLSEFMESYKTTSQFSEEEIVEVEPGGSQVNPDKNVIGKCTSSRILRLSTVTDEDTSKPDFLHSSTSNINKETCAHDIEDSTDLRERERKVDKKVTVGDISVITDNKRLSELIESYESTMEPSAKEIVTVEPGENQVGPSEKVSGKKYSSPKILRLSTVTGEDKETCAYDIEDSTDLRERERIKDRKVTIGTISVKRESYGSTLEPSLKEVVTVEPRENQVVPSESSNGKKYTSPKIFQVSKVHHSKSIKIQITAMMAALTFLYIVNWLPHLIARVVSDRPVNMCDNFIDCGSSIYALCLRSYYLLSASNAFVYSFCNSTFRKESRNLLSMILNFCKRGDTCSRRLHSRA